MNDEYLLSKRILLVDDEPELLDMVFPFWLNTDFIMSKLLKA